MKKTTRVIYFVLCCENEDKSLLFKKESEGWPHTMSIKIPIYQQRIQICPDHQFNRLIKSRLCHDVGNPVAFYALGLDDYTADHHHEKDHPCNILCVVLRASIRDLLLQRRFHLFPVWLEPWNIPYNLNSLLAFYDLHEHRYHRQICRRILILTSTSLYSSFPGFGYPPYLDSTVPTFSIQVSPTTQTWILFSKLDPSRT
mmetsp:Transcript_6244/g.20012  ORF Transcript_6244/g.20012 Transcript_6244/m.20012 type:complete len:200 (+) Transcript_6244:151-750(+)